MVAETLAAGALRVKCQGSEQTPSAAQPDWAGDIQAFSPKRPPGVVNQPLERAQQPARVVFVRMFNVWGHITSVTRSEATAAIV